MAEAIRKVNVVGHQHPDTDSICAAISYAHLKNVLGGSEYEARRAGTINRETAFVLRHFGFEEPQAIYKWQRGEAMPTIDNLVILAVVFQVKIDDILILDERVTTKIIA